MPIDADLLERIKSNDPNTKTLDLSRVGFTIKDVKQLVKALETNTNLTSLNLSGNKISNGSAKILAKYITLTSLDLSSNRIDDEGASAFTHNTTLTSLDLSGNLIDDEGAKALAKNTTLTSLDLSSNRIGNEVAKALAKNTTLTSLCLKHNNGINDEGAKAFAKNTTLTKLNLWSWFGAGPKVIMQLKQAIEHNRQRQLKKKTNDINNNNTAHHNLLSLPANTTKPSADKKDRMDLETTPLTDKTLTHSKQGNTSCSNLINKAKSEENKSEIAEIDGRTKVREEKSPSKIIQYSANKEPILPFDDLLDQIRENDPNLKTIDLSNQELHSSDIVELVEALESNTVISELYLGHNQINDEGAKTLAKNSSITKLDLSDNQIGDNGAKALAKITTLTSLNLKGNQISDTGACAFTRNATLTSLDLSKNLLDDDGAYVFSHNTTLKSLNLSKNLITDGGIFAFVYNSTLTSLDISDNLIGDQGVYALAKNTSLTSLNLSGNLIGDEGAKALTKNTTLTELSLKSLFDVSHEVRIQLCQAIQRNRLRKNSNPSNDINNNNAILHNFPALSANISEPSLNKKDQTATSAKNKNDINNNNYLPKNDYEIDPKNNNNNQRNNTLMEIIDDQMDLGTTPTVNETFTNSKEENTPFTSSSKLIDQAKRKFNINEAAEPNIETINKDELSHTVAQNKKQKTSSEEQEKSIKNEERSSSKNTPNAAKANTTSPSKPSANQTLDSGKSTLTIGKNDENINNDNNNQSVTALMGMVGKTTNSSSNKSYFKTRNLDEPTKIIEKNILPEVNPTDITPKETSRYEKQEQAKSPITRKKIGRIAECAAYNTLLEDYKDRYDIASGKIDTSLEHGFELSNIKKKKHKNDPNKVPNSSIKYSIKVTWFNKKIKDDLNQDASVGRGYDIDIRKKIIDSSSNKESEKIQLVEVKGTENTATTPTKVQLSKNELKTMLEQRDRFKIYRVYGVGGGTENPIYTKIVKRKDLHKHISITEEGLSVIDSLTLKL